MKYLLKFNEADSPKILSNDRIEEINKDISLTSSQIDDIVEKYNSLYEELESFTTKENRNSQIDNAWVNLKTFLDKIDESKKLLNLISGKLTDYTQQGEKYLA
jgi:septal ring factor EnvC (AmiA/AmiB activator)